MKTCYNCKETKSPDLFYNDRRSKDGKAAGCKACRSKKQLEYKLKDHEKHKQRMRNNKLKCTYGITLDQFNNIFNTQGKCCAVCGSKESKGVGFVLDHNHTTGKVRGILCALCNKGLGYFGDMPEGLERAFNYLKENQ